MGCCILAAMIVGQIFEFWRRFKGLFGFASELYPDPYAEPEPVVFYERLRSLMRKPALRVGFVLLLVTEAVLASSWLLTEHEEHLQMAGAYVKSLIGYNEAAVVICSVKNPSVVPQVSAAQQ